MNYWQGPLIVGGAKEDWLELRLAWSVVRSFTHTYKEREREREREFRGTLVNLIVINPFCSIFHLYKKNSSFFQGLPPRSAVHPMRVSAAILIYNLYCNLYFHLSHIYPCLCIGLLGTWLLHDDVLCYAYLHSMLSIV